MGTLFEHLPLEKMRGLKPPLKWASGKRWLVPHLRQLYTPHRRRRLVEPFCGGLAVTLGLLPEKALLNDINPHLINFCRWLQKGLWMEIPMANEAVLYYQYRKRFHKRIRKNLAESAEDFSYADSPYDVPFWQYSEAGFLFRSGVSSGVARQTSWPCRAF